MKDNLVVQHNDLVTASYAMTRHEQNVLLSCISQIDSRKRLEEGQVFTLSRLSKLETCSITVMTNTTHTET